jgi:predicted O-linked N-acetylglucosamine transferase (SPINDLY family)
LDTLPYNAHTSACDALWAGVPLLTLLGNSFAGRAAASALNAVGLPDLIAPTAAAYEAKALSLARNPDALAEVRAQLLRNRDASSLFDPPRFTRNLERAFETMWARHQDGQAPASFAVARNG